MRKLIVGMFTLAILLTGFEAQAGWNATMFDEDVRFMPGLNMAGGDAGGAYSAISPPAYRVELGPVASIGLAVFDVGLGSSFGDDGQVATLHGGVGLCVNLYLTVCAAGVRDFVDNEYRVNYVAHLADMWRQYSPFKASQ